LLARPKLVALLAYLAVARPRGFHRRDRIVAVFWPELDQAHARNALRQAVHHLRATLGPDVLVARGDEELAVDPARVHCDVARLDDLLTQGREAEALELARGELLPGFHLSDAPDFERWLDEERAHIQRRVAGSAATLAEADAARGNLVGAARWARRAVEAAPYDEEGLRRLLRLLDRAGDRAGAVQAYETFARQLGEDLDVEPAPESQALITAIRARIESAVVAVGSADVPAGGDSPPREAVAAHVPPMDREPRSLRVPRFVALTLGIAAIVVAAWTTWSRLRDRDGLAGRDLRPSVAVLPLTNLSGTPAEDYVADGITEELIGELGRIGGLRVISRTSVTQFENSPLAISVIADSLGVGHVIEGGIVREGDRILLRVQLIRAEPEGHVWTERFDRDVRDVYVLQREIAESVAHALGAAHGAAEEHDPAASPRVRPDVFDFYLRGLRELNTLGFDRATAYLDSAIRRDSTFAPAYAALARAYLGEHAFDSLPASEAYAKGRAAAERALLLDPSSVEAHVTLGEVHVVNWEWTDAESDIRRALEISATRAEAHAAYAVLLCLVGRHDRAIEHARAALRLDPLSPKRSGGLGEILFCARRYDEAIEHLEMMAELGMPSYENLAHAYLWAGRYDAGLAAMRAAEEEFFPDPGRSSGLALAFAVAGDDREARRILGNIAQEGGGVGPVELAMAWAHLGERDRAFQYLEDAYRRHDAWLPWLRTPFFDPLRGDPRYGALIARIGLPRTDR
jgi:TolB-like protein/DNA-binding SARP family transcriptional activator/Tfp pilus assembly protein PilF